MNIIIMELVNEIKSEDNLVINELSLLSVEFLSQNTDRNVETHPSMNFRKMSSINQKLFSVESMDHAKPLSNEIIFNDRQDNYTVLQKGKKTEFPFIQNSKNNTPITNRARLFLKGIIQKIILTDFPNEINYILEFNGINICTSRAENINGVIYQTFNFLLEPRSKKLDAMMIITNTENNLNKFGHTIINFNKIDVTNIIAPKKLKLNDVHNIEVHELVEIDNNTVTPHTYNKKVYINNIHSFSHFFGPTHCLILKTFNNPVKFSILINDEEYGIYETVDTSYIYLFNTNNEYLGAQNNYMNNLQNSNSINFSEIVDLNIVFHQTNNISNPIMTQMSYETYDKKLLTTIFDN